MGVERGVRYKIAVNIKMYARAGRNTGEQER